MGCFVLSTLGVHAQAPPPAPTTPDTAQTTPDLPATPTDDDGPTPLWDTQIGASFVGASGNADATSLGADFSMHRRWTEWQVASTASAVRASNDGVSTAERYIGEVRGERKLTTIMGLSSGERLERDRLAGTDFRSILDLGVSWTLVRSSRWTFDATTSAAWKHEKPIDSPAEDHPIGLLQAVNWMSLGPNGDTTQRFTFYPDFEESSDYRAEAEVQVEAGFSRRLGFKLDYLWRYSHLPVAGFKAMDNTTTASLVLRWRSAKRAP
jgi:putative salt-induced outer membrane protein YdiY